MNKVTLAFVLLLSHVTASANASQVWQHDGEPAQLIELFTSEGCSSCPPADKYLSQFQGSKNLWTDVIPLAFHVDYWNYLGWKDVFSHPSFSQRQRIYQSYGASQSVYTPGFFVDGKEWQGYFSRRSLPAQSSIKTGKLVLTQSNNQFDVNYQAEGRFIAHLALIALDEKTSVRAGENHGKELEHDFVVLQKHQLTSENSWKFSLATIPENTDAVAVWLTKEDGFKPVQTVAGYFNTERSN